MSQRFSTYQRTRPTPPVEATGTPPCHPLRHCLAHRETRLSRDKAARPLFPRTARGLSAPPRAFVRLCRYPPTARQNPMHLYGHPPSGSVRPAAKQEFGTTDARRFTRMGPSPAWPFMVKVEQPILASRAGAVAPVPSACIGVHLRFQILASPQAALGCGGGWSSPQAEPHAPIHPPAAAAPLGQAEGRQRRHACQNPMHQFVPRRRCTGRAGRRSAVSTRLPKPHAPIQRARKLRSAPGRQCRSTAVHLREAIVSPEWRHETMVRQLRWACPASVTLSLPPRNETTARQARHTPPAQGNGAA
jgi:hypothetical protein